LEASFSGLCVVFVSRVLWTVRVSWRGGPSAQKTRVLSERNAPLYHTGTTQCCSYTPCTTGDRQCHSNGSISQVVQRLCMPFPGDCISQARNGRGIKETAFKPLGKQPVGLLGACMCSDSAKQWARGWYIAGPAINPVQGFSTLPDLHWEFLRLWTGFELSSSCANLPCYAPNRNRNSFCVMI
jgi:hypothetical protein